MPDTIDYSAEDEHMAHCDHPLWMKICVICGKTLDDNSEEYQAGLLVGGFTTSGSNRTSYHRYLTDRADD